MNTLYFFGLKRSGNHFIISCLRQLYENFVHVNDSQISYESYCSFKNIEKVEEYSDLKLIGFKNSDFTIISLENKTNFEEINKFKNVENVKFAILIRNPYSYMSSVWKYYGGDEKTMRQRDKVIEAKNLWLYYSEIFINSNSNIVKVIYDKFCSNEKYKLSFLRQFKEDIKLENIDFEQKIKWQRSSFEKKENQRRVNEDLETCIFKDNVEFKNLFCEKIKSNWKMILNKNSKIL